MNDKSPLTVSHTARTPVPEQDSDQVKIEALTNAVDFYRDELKAKDAEIMRLRESVSTLQKALSLDNRSIPFPKK